MKTIELKGHTFELAKLSEQYNRYMCSENVYLSQVYGRWSSAKERAYAYCAELARQCDYVGFAIVSHNQCFFTVGFTFYCNGCKWFAYITKDHDYVMRLD